MLLGWLVINGLYLAVALWHSGTLAVTCLLPVRYADLKSAKSARVSSDFLIKAIFDFGNYFFCHMRKKKVQVSSKTCTFLFIALMHVHSYVI